MKKEKIIIVGAGVAGLVLARELADDHEVLILEARERTGGRIHSYREKNFPTIIEAGAEFIHGDLEETLGLLKEAGIDYTVVEGDMYDMDNGRYKKITMMIEEWDELLKKMKQEKRDMPLYEFLQLYFGDDKYNDLRRHTISYAEGFDVADTKKVSMQALYREWSADEQKNYRIPAGYSALTDFLAEQCLQKNCRILFNEPVKNIRWEKNKLSVETTAGNQYEGTKLVVTVPLGILQHPTGRASINFNPPVDEQINAAKQIGYGGIVKAELLFKERFWRENTGFIFNDAVIPTWWTKLPDQTPVLTGWAGGPKAARINHDAEAPLLEVALSSLSSIFSLPVKELEGNLQASKIFNWQQNEWSLGGYSYSMPQSSSARQFLDEGVQDTIFFSGEGIYEGDTSGTVEAAIVHAKQTAAKLK